jgi:23S rRNA (adenine2503-C2)-methyltransferase
LKSQIVGFLPEELEGILKDWNEPSYRAKQIFQSIYKLRKKSWKEASNLPQSLVQRLETDHPIPSLDIVYKMPSQDGTIKYTFRAGDKGLIEAVWIPRGDGDRKTICISSQVGCTLNCAFCATGTLEFKGNLETWQILSQVLKVEEDVNDRATNIVFMGMGEPMHNYFQVIRAAKILSHKDAWGLGQKRITISTAGVLSGIRRYIESREPFNLAISLNHPHPDKRTSIMDVNEKNPLEDLIEEAKNYVQKLDRVITFEYVMIPEINMSDDDTRRLVKIAKKVGKCKFNVIPLNTAFHGWSRPNQEEVQRFTETLRSQGLLVLNRNSPGKEIDGACGMLALKGIPESL